jgi:hypothetical protein
MLRIAAVVPLMILLTDPASAQTRWIGREQTISRTTQSGRPVNIFTYAAWHQDCSPDVPPQIVVRTQPEHGTVRIEPRDSEVRFVREGGPDCTGHIIPGTRVIYVPQPGYRGPDRFEYDVLEMRTSRHDTAIIDVR